MKFLGRMIEFEEKSYIFAASCNENEFNELKLICIGL